MNTKSLKQIFQSKFDYPTYCNEVVHNVFGCNDISTHPELLDTTADGDNSYYIGRQTDADGRELGFFYTRVAQGSDVRRKRVGLRKMIAPYLKYDVDAAIAVFVDENHWRLSYICDMKEGVTNAKRFSYILGDEQGQYKTPLERLDTIYAKKGRFVLNDLREAFSVDALSDEFFDEYHIHYDRIVAELARQGKTGAVYHDYVKKLMGRIVFLHFLQKKGWLCGDTNFMFNTFSQSTRRSDYLESVLEPLFFGILNTEPAKREQVFSRNGWQQGLVEKWASIPYLNGGLFERDEVDNLRIALPDYIFSNLFSFLASYNFTVDENDPDDAEIGVDPEMLGKIFESLLEDNKAKGAFYTPKEIVRYMCKESLIAHLASKLPDVADGVVRAFVESHEMQSELEPYRDTLETALREVKICDPAIGSGAFPMGLLNELWRCREALGTQMSRLQLKKEIIENNIYGVDIERGAIDIARLRFWLSIVVDSEKAEPLPNFDYKFMQGNSLIESYGGFDLSRIAGKTVGRPSTSTQLVIGLDSDLSRKNLQKLLHEYFSVTDHQKKATMRHAINAEVKTLIRESVGGTPTFLAKLEQLDPSANQDFFLWHTWFKDIFDKGGVDIVIGNPPYIQLQADGGLLADLYSPFGYSSFDRRGDIYELFYEKGNRILRSNGVLCFITSNGWMKSQYGDNLRYYLASNTNPILLVDFNQMRLFDNAVVETNILMFKKEQNHYQCKACSFLNHEKQTVLANLTYKVEIESSICKFERTGSWTIAEHTEQAIKNKIERIGLLLQKWNVVIYRGITTGCNAGFIIDETTREQIYNKASENERRLLDKTIFPILQGRNLKKYSYVFNDKYMIVTPRGYQINNTPALKSYMLTHYDALSCKSGSNLWYELQASPSETMLRNMHKEKIMWGEISDKAKFTYDKGDYFAEATTFIMTTDDKSVSLKYLLAVLNSALSEWYFHKIATTTGMGTNRWKKYKLEQLPVVKPSKEKETQIVELVNQILEKKRINSNDNTLSLEQEIDKTVFELYGLGPEEIAVIEH